MSEFISPVLIIVMLLERLKEEMVRIAWKEVSFLTIDLTEDEIRWKDLTEADDLSEAQQLELSNIPPEEEWYVLPLLRGVSL